MDFRSRWQEAALLLGAGAQMMPLSNNQSVYRWINRRLDCLRKQGRVDRKECEDAGLRHDLALDS